MEFAVNEVRDGVPSAGHFRPCGLPVLLAPTDEISFSNDFVCMTRQNVASVHIY